MTDSDPANRRWSSDGSDHEGRGADEPTARAPRHSEPDFDDTVDGGNPGYRADEEAARFPAQGFADDQGEPIDVEAIEVELIEFESDADEPVVVQAAAAAGTSVEDDIVDAELIDDPEDVVAQLEAPAAPHALAAAPFVPSDEPVISADSTRHSEPEPDTTRRPESETDTAAHPDLETDTPRAPDTEADSTAHPDPEAQPDTEADSTAHPDPEADTTSRPNPKAGTATHPEADTTRRPDREAEVDRPSDPAPDAEPVEDTPPAAAQAEDSAAGSSDTAVPEGAQPRVEGGSADTEEAQGPAAGASEHDSSAYGREAPPTEPIRQRREQRADPRNRRTDPEQILAAYPVTYDPRTLREQIEDDEPMWVVIDRLTDKLEYAERDSDRARLLSLRAVASRLLGDLDPALEDVTAALVHAEAAGELVRTAIVRARLAHVLQWRGDHAAADRIYTEVNTGELPARLRAEIHELAGRSAFEQGRYLEAVNHLEGALDLRKGTDLDLVERIELALDTITSRTTDGWGPYPRSREEILGRSSPARPVRDETSGLFGYPDLLPARFAQAQPFADGVAWVRRPEAPAWELVDESGALLIDASSGYRAAGRFADGLAWVSRDDSGGWHAIDKQNRVIVPGGFDDARPFHNGLALVRRGGWGAVDQHTRIVVQPHYQAFATMLASGEPVDGFTEEGLAVVDAGEVYGVVDRAGHLLVQPVHAALLIHPAAFLVADKFGLWGALDRKGEPLVELKYRERADVLEEIDKLIKDSRPVL